MNPPFLSSPTHHTHRKISRCGRGVLPLHWSTKTTCIHDFGVLLIFLACQVASPSEGLTLQQERGGWAVLLQAPRVGHGRSLHWAR